MTEKKKKEEDYHGVAPVSSIIKKMKKDYDKDPKDWRVIGSKDKDGSIHNLVFGLFGSEELDDTNNHRN